MLYLKLTLLYIKLIFNIHKYKYFLDKDDGTGRSWTLYKRPIFSQMRNHKKAKIPETKAHHFIYHAFESLESKSTKDFKNEMFDNIALGSIWYISKTNEKIQEKQNAKQLKPDEETITTMD